MATHKILVIDDSGVIRRTVRDMLPEGNFEVLEAKDGIEGLNLIQKERPNLIMLDFVLPKMSGWDVFQQIQTHSEFQKIPLVVMSGLKTEVTTKISEPFEFFEFIEKPFDKKVLIDAIKSAMIKAKKRPPMVTPAAVAAPASVAEPAAAPVAAAGAGEIQELTQKIAKMQAEIDDLKKQVAQMANVPTEIDGLKKQLTQIVTFIKQKLK